MTKARGFLCGPRIYEYDGWVFEYHSFCGPWPLKKDGELRKRAGRTFFKVVDKWLAETNPEQYRIGGGCRAL